MSHRRRYIADCRAVIRERVIYLEYMLAKAGQTQSKEMQDCEKEAIYEARFLDKLLSTLESEKYPKKHPYQEALRRSGSCDGTKLPSRDYGEEWWESPGTAAKALENPNA